VASLIYGPVFDPVDAAEKIAAFGAHCLVGIPTHVLSVARTTEGAAIGKGQIESILLSTDYVPRAIIDSLEEIWGCRVYTHYGMTEMGFGGGVECAALNGYHLREADLYFEIIDPETCEICPDGTIGEVAFTSLTRRGMPLIRYRTGDMAWFETVSCACGTDLRRMGYVGGRWEGAVRLGPDCILTLSMLDEALFRLPGLLDYRATLSSDRGKPRRFHVEVHGGEKSTIAADSVKDALCRVEAVQKAIEAGFLEPPAVHFSVEGRWITTGASKRKLIVRDSSIV
jgi:phenylacetate-CoA ligase